MGIHIKNSTLIGAVTPICNDCGTSLCWDISEEEYLEAKSFWDTWKCRDCNPHYKGAYIRWKIQNKK